MKEYFHANNNNNNNNNNMVRTRMMKQCALYGECDELYHEYCSDSRSRSRSHSYDEKEKADRDGDDDDDAHHHDHNTRLKLFQETVQLIYQHDHHRHHRLHHEHDEKPRYHLTLNQFADRRPNFSPSSSSTTTTTTKKTTFGIEENDYYDDREQELLFSHHQRRHDYYYYHPKNGDEQDDDDSKEPPTTRNPSQQEQKSQHLRALLKRSSADDEIDAAASSSASSTSSSSSSSSSPSSPSSSSSSSFLMIPLDSEDTIRSLVFPRPLIMMEGKIYYPKPSSPKRRKPFTKRKRPKKKETKAHRTINNHHYYPPSLSPPAGPSTFHAGSKVVLPDSITGPPPKVKLSHKMVRLEHKYPFGGSLFVSTGGLGGGGGGGREINLATKHSFRWPAAASSSSTADHDHDNNDRYATSLNWATRNNPDRVPLVHDVFDQGSCGSCWAYVATGSLETSLARRAARSAYWRMMNSNSNSNSNATGIATNTTTNDDGSDAGGSNVTTTLNSASSSSSSSSPSSGPPPPGLALHRRRAAKQFARQVEQDIFDQTRLSIQELLDCDTSVDQGCIGGNPLLAFFYIHKYGLTRWEDYPYIGKQAETCSRELLPRDELAYMDLYPNYLRGNTSSSSSSSSSSANATSNSNDDDNKDDDTTSSFPPPRVPVATVDSWGILPQNHEDLIQVALRYIGPVAVAINGADASFIAYGGGIFDKQSCNQDANHAVLIVGYGQEEETIRPGKNETRTVRYWIARNSWGTSWGENGFIRILRGPGGKKISGICGLARSPSVALGGRDLFSEWSKDDSLEIMEDERRTGTGPSLSHDDRTNGADDDWFLNSDDSYHHFLIDQFCDSIIPPYTFWHVGCHRLVYVFDLYRATSLGVFSAIIFSLLAWFLSFPCRSRREQRRRFKAILREHQRQQQLQSMMAKHSSSQVNKSDDDEGDDDYDADDDAPSSLGSNDGDEDDGDLDDDDDEHLSSPSQGSLSLSSVEEDEDDHHHDHDLDNVLDDEDDDDAKHSFGILEEDLEVLNEQTPFLRGGGITPIITTSTSATTSASANNNTATSPPGGSSSSLSPHHYYGSIATNTTGGLSPSRISTINDHHDPQHPPNSGSVGAAATAANQQDFASSFLSSRSTSSGRSWFFMPK